MASATEQDQAAREMYGHAVRMRPTQPKTALSIFSSLRAKQINPLGQAAGEQKVITLQTLGRFEDAQSEARRLMDELKGDSNEVKSDSKQSYFYARVAILWAEIAIAKGDETGAARVLGEARRIFELNADFYHLGVTETLMAAISASNGEFVVADTQARRGESLTSTHARQQDYSSLEQLVGAGAGNSTN